jgi:hypothetical protein
MGDQDDPQNGPKEWYCCLAPCEIPSEGRKAKGTISHPQSYGTQIPLIIKTNVIADCLENQFSPHDLCEEHREQLVVTRIQALFETVDNDPLERVRPCDVQKITNSN